MKTTKTCKKEKNTVKHVETSTSMLIARIFGWKQLYLSTLTGSTKAAEDFSVVFSCKRGALRESFGVNTSMEAALASSKLGAPIARTSRSRSIYDAVAN